jgi:hypothetical protein
LVKDHYSEVIIILILQTNKKQIHEKYHYGISKMKENEITVKMHNNAEHVYTKSILINDKPITNISWVRAQLCKLQKRVHSTRSRKG